jgi:hypothetical protein
VMQAVQAWPPASRKSAEENRRAFVSAIKML